MTAHVRNGVIELDKPIPLPEGLALEVTPLSTPDYKALFPDVAEDEQIPTLLERLSAVVGAAEDLPPDLAAQHNHYLHGWPKR